MGGQEIAYSSLCFDATLNECDAIVDSVTRILSSLGRRAGSELTRLRCGGSSPVHLGLEPASSPQIVNHFIAPLTHTFSFYRSERGRQIDP